VIEPKQTGQSRLLWIGAGVLAFMTVFTCIALFSVGMLLSNANAEATPMESNARYLGTSIPIAQAVATPVQSQVVIQPPPEGVDYESAVLMQIYQDVNPSVVNLTIYQLGSSIHAGEVPGLNPDDYYQASGGSGFVWDANGHIVTNNHVVEGADRIVVRFSDGTMSVATLVGNDEDSDLAVVKIDPTGYALVPVRLGNLDNVRVGQRVAAIGNPFGLEGTLTSGIVSAIGRSIPARASFSIPASIQTDAPINPGNSGGPLLNERGEVIGVNAQIRSDERANSGVGFAIPIPIVERVVPALIADGGYQHPYIGISGSTLSPICAAELELDPSLRGALVLTVLRNTPAQRAGLRAGTQEITPLYPEICPSARGGDLIVSINDEAVTSFDGVLAYLQRYTSPGDTVNLTVLRGGEYYEIPVTLTARPSN
jgi:2-alkenal reductase